LLNTNQNPGIIFFHKFRAPEIFPLGQEKEIQMCAVLELTDRKKPLRQQCEKQQPVNLKKSERLYTHSKAREKLALRSDKLVIRKRHESIFNE
jgi:hypothetical protein